MRLKGRLIYMGWFNLPWKLVTDDGEVDLWPIVDRLLVSLDGKHVNHDITFDGYTLFADEFSGLRFKYVRGKFVLLENPQAIHNVFAYLDSALCRLSGRLVEIEIEDGGYVKFTADSSEEVLGVYFAGGGNSCEVPSGAENTVCKAGQPDCCIFLSMGADGWSCEKFNDSLARVLLDRLAKGTIRASRIGNCALLGRKEDSGDRSGSQHPHDELKE